MPFEFGSVVLVPFPFTSQTASKKRPAVVVSNRAYSEARPDLIVMAITSQLRASPGMGETWVAQWQAAGLLKPSARASGGGLGGVAAITLGSTPNQTTI
jgi:mRNA interferase MazF